MFLNLYSTPNIGLESLTSYPELSGNLKICTGCNFLAENSPNFKQIWSWIFLVEHGFMPEITYNLQQFSGPHLVLIHPIQQKKVLVFPSVTKKYILHHRYMVSKLARRPKIVGILQAFLFHKKVTLKPE